MNWNTKDNFIPANMTLAEDTSDEATLIWIVDQLNKSTIS